MEKSNFQGISNSPTALNNNDAPEAGAVFVFVKNSNRWEQQAYIKASNTNSSMRFGISVDISGETMVVGAPWEGSDSTGVNGDQTNKNAPVSGAAYVFQRNNGSWMQEAYLKASNNDRVDEFGSRVSIDGNKILVGAPKESGGTFGINADQQDNSLGSSGAAYLFSKNEDQWQQEAYIKAPTPKSANFFGGSGLSVLGESLIIGATGYNIDQAFSAGTVYIFDKKGW